MTLESQVALSVSWSPHHVPLNNRMRRNEALEGCWREKWMERGLRATRHGVPGATGPGSADSFPRPRVPVSNVATGHGPHFPVALDRPTGHQTTSTD